MKRFKFAHRMALRDRGGFTNSGSKTRKVLVDNFSSHNESAEMRSSLLELWTVLLKLSWNSTDHIQPADSFVAWKIYGF